MTRREIVRCENCVCWYRGPTERGTESVFGLCRRDPEPRTTSEDWGCHGGLERDGEKEDGL